MSLLDQLTEEMKRCLKARDVRRLSAVRLLISAIKYAKVDKDDLGDGEMVEVLQREAKKRRESIAAYANAGRAERAAEEDYELSVIEEYLPKMMGEQEVEASIAAILGSETFANPGLAIGKVMASLKGKAEGQMVSRLVLAYLKS